MKRWERLSVYALAVDNSCSNAEQAVRKMLIAAAKVAETDTLSVSFKSRMRVPHLYRIPC